MPVNMLTKERRKVMEYNALIQWQDTGEFEDVIITTNKETQDDDYIFFYFESVQEIESYRKRGVNDFRVVSYLPTRTRDWYHKLRSPKHTDENTGDSMMYI